MDGYGKKKELRHDRHTVSLLTDHLVITPKYRGKILTGEVGFVAEAIIRGTCAEMGIRIIDMAVNADHVHLYRQKNQRKIKQDIETGVPSPSKVVWRSSLVSWMLSWLCWTGLGSCGKIYFFTKLFSE